MKTLFRLIALGSLLMLAACATTSGSNQAPPFNPDAQEVKDYHIGVDDQIQVTVWQNPDLSVSAPVRPDGKVAAPHR